MAKREQTKPQTPKMNKKIATAILKSYQEHTALEVQAAVKYLEGGANNAAILEDFRKHYYEGLDKQGLKPEDYLLAKEILGDSQYTEMLKADVEAQPAAETEAVVDGAADTINKNVTEMDRISGAVLADVYQSDRLSKLADIIMVPVVDENGNPSSDNGHESYYGSSEKTEFLKAAYEAAATKVMLDNAYNAEFAAKSAQEKQAYVKNAIENQFMADIVTMHIASGVNQTLRNNLDEIIPDLPAKPQKTDSAEAHQQYNQLLAAKVSEAMQDPAKSVQVAAKFDEAMDKIAESEGHLTISPLQFMNNLSDKQVEAGMVARQLFKASKNAGKKFDVRKAAITFRRYESKLSALGQKLHGKIYNFAVGVKEFARNDTGKAIEIVGQLGITGGNMALAGMGWAGVNTSGSGLASVLAGAMVAHTFAKGAVYPVVTEWKKLAQDSAFNKLSWFQKYKAARKAAKAKDPNLNWHLATGGLALVAWGAGHMALGPLGGKIAAAATIAWGNAIIKQREFNHTKRLYEMTGDEQYRKELYGDKSQPANGLFGKIKKLFGSKNAQKKLAWFGALAGTLGVATQINRAVEAGQGVAGVTTVRAAAEPVQVSLKDTQLSTPLREGWGALPRQPQPGSGVLLPEQQDTVANTNISDNTPHTAAGAINTEAAPEIKVGDVVSSKDYGHGITETRTMGKDGIVYQQVSGLKGGIVTSDKVQAFYEARIHNMNQYHKLIEVLPDVDGHKMTVNEAVDAMLEQYKEGFVKLPEGMTPEHAIHTAFMHAAYTGDLSAIKALGCPNGEDTVAMFDKLAGKYSTDIRFVGRPVDPNWKLPVKAGTTYINAPCETATYTGTEEAAPTVHAAAVIEAPAFGESDYQVNAYVPKTHTEVVPGTVKYVISGPHGAHPIPEDATIEISPDQKEVIVKYTDGRNPELYSSKSIYKEVVPETVVTKEEPYVPHTAQEMAAAAEEAGCKPGVLTHTSTFNGVDQYKQFTSDGVVVVRVGSDHVPHYTMEDYNGKPGNVPAERVKSHFTIADKLLRAGGVPSNASKAAVSQTLLSHLNGKGR